MKGMINCPLNGERSARAAITGTLVSAALMPMLLKWASFTPTVLNSV
jgi:hypothetical protein